MNKYLKIRPSIFAHKLPKAAAITVTLQLGSNLYIKNSSKTPNIKAQIKLSTCNINCSHGIAWLSKIAKEHTIGNITKTMV